MVMINVKGESSGQGPVAKKLSLDPGSSIPASAQQPGVQSTSTGNQLQKFYSKEGLVHTLHGNIYQLKLLMLFLKRALKQKYSFRLGTEVETAAKFDDLVFHYKTGTESSWTYRFLQAKHKQDESRKINVHDLLTDRDDDFSLQKYFISYCKIKKDLKEDIKKQHKEFTDAKIDAKTAAALQDFILCTNIDFDFDNSFNQPDLKKLLGSSLYLKPVPEDDDILDVSTPSKNPQRYRLVVDEQHELYEKLRETSNLYLLAKELADHVLNNKKLELRSDIFRKYHVALVNEKVIDRNTKKLHNDFIENKVSRVQKLREIFFKDFKKRAKLDFELNKNPQLSDVQIFAKEIARLIEETKDHVVTIDRSKYKKNAKQGSIERIVADNIQDGSPLAGHILVEDEEGKNLIFSSLFLDDNNQLPGNLEEFKTALKAALQTQGINFSNLKDYKFIINNFKTCKEEQLGSKPELPNDEIEDSAIKAFFEKLVFAVNQPNEEALGSIIAREIGKDSKFNLLNADLVSDSFQRRMLDWFKEKRKEKGKEGEWLTEQHGAEFFNSIESKINTIIATGFHLVYREKLEEYGIDFDENPIKDELKTFLSGNRKSTFHVFDEADNLFSAIKVYRSLENLKGSPEELIKKYAKSLIFIKLTTLLRPEAQRLVINTFNSEDGHYLLVITCNSKEKKVVELHQKLSEVIGSKPEKKIILITKEKEDPLASKFASNAEPPIEDTTRFSDLKPTSQKKLLGKNLILLQEKGEKTSLNQLIHPFPVDIIDVNTFVDLIQDKEINIGSQLTDLGKVKDYYIDRKFYQIEIKTNIETDRAFPDKLGYTKENFNQLCEESPDSNIHWLKSESGKLIWQQSQGSVSALRKYIQSGESRINYYSESDLLNHSVGHKVVVIADTAGMGKSTVLTSLSQAMKDKSSCRWVIRINLIKYTDQLNELKSNQFNKDQAIDFLLNKLLKLNDSLEKKLLEKYLDFGSNNGMQVVILLDGFDEITPDYKDIVINLLGELKKTKVEKLLVTTRPNMRTDLESKLNVLAYDLKPFSKEKDQIDFLALFWKQKFNQENFSQVNDQKLKIYANELITLLSGSTSGKQTEFTGIPLHISMVAEVFYENKEGKQEKAWQGCKEFLDTTNIPNQKPTLPNQFNIAELYERFVKTKFYDIHFKEKREIDFTKPGIKRTFDRDYKEFIKQQQELALYALLNNEEFTKLSSTNQEKINGWIQDIKSGDENQGIIDQIIDDKPHFTHATFAEYFVSFPFAEKMVSDFSGTLEHVNKILPNTSPIFINSIIKQLEDTKRTEGLALLEGKPLINFAAQNGYLNLVKTLLESNHDAWPQSDNLGKTPLHYAAEHGHSDIVEYLLNYNNDILEKNILEHGTFKKEEYRESQLVKFVNKPDNDGKAALYYAAKNNRMEIACDLLLKGADSSQLNEDTRPLVSYVIEQVHGAYANQDHKLRQIEEKLLLQDPSAASTLRLSYEFPRLLSYFFMHGRVQVIIAILDTISNTEIRRNLLNQDDNGITPLDRVNLSKELSDDDRLRITKYLVDNGGTKTNYEVDYTSEEEGSSYYTKILQAAARDGHIKTFKYFINQENRDYYYLHLYQATRNNQIDIIQYLFDNHREDIKHDGNTALHSAVDSGANLKNIKYLIDSGEDVNAKNDRGESPLFQAIYAKRGLNIIRYLIDCGADVNMQDNELKTPLYYAIENEDTDPNVIKYLLVTRNANIPESVRNQAGFFKNPHEFDLNLIDENGMPRLHKAIQSNDIDWGKFIIRKGGDINLKDKEGKTPLHWASQLQQIKIVELLLQYGAMYNVVDLNGKTPRNLLENPNLLNERSKKIVWLLDTLDQLFNSKNLIQDLNDKLLSDTQHGTQYSDASDTHNPTLFILNAQDNKNNALLHLATDKNDQQALIALLKANQDYLKEKRQGWSPHYRDYQFRSINGVNKDGNMPIHIAVIKGNTNMVRLLLNNGAIFNAKNNAGRTPEELSNEHNIPDTLLQSVNAFFNAVDSGEKQVIEDYTNKDRTLKWIDIRDKSGKTALHRAASSGKIDIIQLLLNNNADIDSLDVNHYTPLHFAAENDKMEIVKFLLQQGANFNVKNKEGKSPFELIENQSSRLLGSINELFISIDSDNPEGIINHLKIIDIAKTHNIKIETIVNVRDNQGNTLLHYAAENGYLDIVKFLLQHGAIFNSENKFKSTPKEFTSNKNIVGLLSSIDEIFKYTNHIHQTQVDMKIITNVRNDKGMTILHAAVEEGNNHIVVALLKAGANIDAEDIYNNKPLYYAQQEYTKNILEKIGTFIVKVQEQVQACGIEKAVSDVIATPELYTQAIKTVPQQLATGEVETIPQLLCDKIVQQCLQQNSSLEAPPEVLGNTTTDVNLLKQSICSMTPIDQVTDSTPQMGNTYNANYALIQNSIDHGNRKCVGL